GPQAFAAVYGTNTSVPGFTNTGLGASGSMRKGNWGGTVDYVTSDFDGLTDKAYSAAVNFIDDHHLAELRYTDVGEKFSPPISLVPYRDRVGGYAYYQNRKDIRTGPFRRQTFTFYTG